MFDGLYRAEFEFLRAAKHSLKALADGQAQNKPDTKRKIIKDLQKVIWLLEHKPHYT